MGWAKQALCHSAKYATGLFLLLSLFSATGAATSDLFLPERATVVLLSGLPGDLESENTYRDHLTAWLDLLRQGPAPAHTYVLSDSTNTATALENTSVMAASRSNFLALAQQLSGLTNQLVVVAWGHAGRQGSTPVFHVHGPRLAPADFATFAEQANAPSSSWVLVFRGSGAFAAGIAAEKRRILSSDSATMFGSDPISMAILLKLLRSDPPKPFASIISEFGQATAQWYTDRSLARTEEPSFWNGLEKPVALASTPAVSSPGEAQAALKAEDEKEPAIPAKPAQAAVVPLPSSWSSIQKVAPEDYPDMDAVSLYRKTSFTLAKSPAVAGEVDDYIQVLTPEGKRFGDFDVSYHPPDEDLTFIDCEVLRPDGRLERLDPDAVREAKEEALGAYELGQRKFFSLPGVAPGAVLHVRYRTSWKTFPLPHVSMALPLSRDIPQLQQILEISVPKDSPFHFAFENVKVSDPSVRQSTYGTTYGWNVTNTPPFERDVLMSPGQRPQVLFSTFPNWTAFATWYSRLTQLTDQAGEELVAKARELTQSAKDDREKVLALYNYVTSMRYVAVPLGVNSLRPHSAENVFRNQYGDCKDKANLFNTMLKSLGLEAHLVLVPRFGQAHDSIPGLAFNHAISRVSLNGEMLWIDTTDDVCRFGMLPPGDPGRKVLVIDGATTNLTALPWPKPADHALSLSASIQVPKETGFSKAQIKLRARGYPDYALRSTRQMAKSHANSLPVLAAEYQPTVGVFALQKQSSSAVSALDQDFTWEGNGQFAGHVAHASDHLLVSGPFWLPDEWFLALHERTSPLFLNQGYPVMLEQDLLFTLPDSSGTAQCPADASCEKLPLKWQLQWRQVSPGTFSAQLRLELSQGEFDMVQTRTFQAQLGELIAACARPMKVPLSSKERSP